MSDLVDVLVVEDNAADVELIQVIIKDYALPYRLHVAEDGEAALAFLRNSTPAPRLMLLDFNMPRLSGPEVLRTIHKEKLPSPVVVMFTSSQAAHDRQAALDLGAAAYVVKPILFDDFCRTVMQIFQEHAPAPAPPEPGIHL